MSSTFRPPPRYTPPLLSSKSLEGLEQFVPPENYPYRSFIPSWKLDKPLPELPRRTSSVYSHEDSFSEASECYKIRGYRRGPSDHGTHSKQRTPINTCSLEGLRLYNRRGPVGSYKEKQSYSPFYKRSPSHNETSSSSSKFTRSPTLPISHSGSGRSSPGPRLGIKIETRKAGNECSTLKSGEQLSPETLDSTDPALVPLPLDIDESFAARDGVQSPSSMVSEFNNHGVCLCCRPHPSHNGVLSGSTRSNSAHSPQIEWSNPVSSIASVKQSVRQNTQTGADGTEVYSRNQSVGSEYPNRTRLYSFSTGTSFRNSDNSEGNDGTYLSPIKDVSKPSSSSVSPPQPQAQRQRQRNKQLAIPSSDYQKYGPKIWSKNNLKRKGSQIIPRLVNKLLPKTLRSPVSFPSLRPPRTSQGPFPYRPGEKDGVTGEWDQLGGNKKAWRSTLGLSRGGLGLSRSEKKRKEGLKSHIVMVGPSGLQLVDEKPTNWV